MPAQGPLRIALVAGEASGDLLGARLVEGLRRLHPSLELVGVCGPAMRRAGVEAWADCSELSVMGLAEVLRHLPRLLRLRRRLRQRVLDWRPDVLIGIDAPDFNLGLERACRARGIRTLHYVSPSVWAWREGRAAKIGRSADRVLCLFPMEPPIYRQHGVTANFVGHPLAAQFPLQPEPCAARAQLELKDDRRWLALLPGSRLGEINRLSEAFIHAAALLRREHPEFSLLVPFATSATRERFAQLFDDTISKSNDALSTEQAMRSELADLYRQSRLIEGDSHAVLQAADLVLLASGTAALEAMLAKQPMVVGYKIAPLTYWLVKRLGLLKVEHYSLPNVLADAPLVPECMQENCTPRQLADALIAWWREPERRQQAVQHFVELHRRLLPPQPDAAARSVLDLLGIAPAQA